MAWKPKEKELTPEQAVALAKEELAPYWIRTEPLAAALEKKGKAYLHPLDEEIRQDSWIFYLVDPSTVDSEFILNYLHEFKRRYQSHDIRCILVVQARYECLKIKAALEDFLEDNQIRFPVVIDFSGLYAKALGLDKPPGATLLIEGKGYHQFQESTWLNDLEQFIHQYLREKDPGLSLLPVYNPDPLPPRDRFLYEFGKGNKTKLEAIPAEKLSALKSGKQMTIPDGVIYYSGKWTVKPEYIGTKDPEAFLLFRNQTKNLSVFAQSLGQTIEPARIMVETVNAPAFSEFHGRHLMSDDGGHTYLGVTHPSLYHALSGMTQDVREVTLRFPLAERVPVGVYSLRMSE